LAHYCKEGDDFLKWIVTGDETWVHHYQPETKEKRMQWKRALYPVAKKFKTQPSAGKLMLTMFWDSQGPILVTYLECGTTITSATYCDMLKRGLKPAVYAKKRERLTEGFLLLHSSVCPHIVARTLEKLWEVMVHPAHSPDLAPSDFHLFELLKNFRKEKNAVHQ
jgi:histone-lysine N-methyltransferase SETMAR